MSITLNILATRYATKEMVAIFDPVNKIVNERKFLIIILILQQKQCFQSQKVMLLLMKKLLKK